MKTDGDSSLMHAKAEVQSRFGGGPVAFVFSFQGQERPAAIFLDLEVAWRVVTEANYSGLLRAYPADEMLVDWCRRTGDPSIDPELEDAEGIAEWDTAWAPRWRFRHGSHVSLASS